MAKPGLRKVFKYSEEFKATAVALSRMEGVAVQDVAAELDIHPFMLSRWKKEYRDGKLKPAKSAGLSLPEVLRSPVQDLEKRKLKREVQRLQAKVEARSEARLLERKLAALQVEHDLLKKAIRFNIERRRRNSSS